MPEGATLFLMSDEENHDYFDSLKNRWKIVRYYDFPELEQLVNQPNPLLSDNYGLFLIEGLVCYQARIKIIPSAAYAGRFSLLFAHPFGKKTIYYLLDEDINVRGIPFPAPKLEAKAMYRYENPDC